MLRNRLVHLFIWPLVLSAGVVLVKYESGARQEREQEEWRDLKLRMDETTARTNAALLDQRVRFVRVKFGDVDARLFELCHTAPPKNLKNQQRCKALDGRVALAEKRQPEW